MIAGPNPRVWIVFNMTTCQTREVNAYSGSDACARLGWPEQICVATLVRGALQWSPLKDTTVLSIDRATSKSCKLHFRDGVWMKTSELVTLRTAQFFCFLFTVFVFGIIGACFMRACCQ